MLTIAGSLTGAWSFSESVIAEMGRMVAVEVKNQD